MFSNPLARGTLNGTMFAVSAIKLIVTSTQTVPAGQAKVVDPRLAAGAKEVAE
jgi:hypothetical protein